MSRLSSATKLWYKFEDWRLSLHFKRVEAILRKRDVRRLSPTLQQAREHYLDYLHTYAVRGVFPRNYERFIYSPCFIDRDGRDCAVAHLVKVSGRSELAQEIALAVNYAYISEMNFSELDEWAAQAGLSKEELALIQPGYWYTFSGSLLTISVISWIAGFTLFLQLKGQRKGVSVPIIALLVTTILALLCLVCLYGAFIAFELGISPDGYPYDRPLRDVPPLLFGGLTSLVVAMLAGGLALYRIWQSFQTRHKS